MNFLLTADVRSQKATKSTIEIRITLAKQRKWNITCNDSTIFPLILPLPLPLRLNLPFFSFFFCFCFCLNSNNLEFLHLLLGLDCGFFLLKHQFSPLHFHFHLIASAGRLRLASLAWLPLNTGRQLSLRSTWRTLSPLIANQTTKDSEKQ